MNREFAGRSAIVTGGSRGIGYAVAAMLAERGAAVTLVARDREKLEAAGSRIAALTGAAIATVAGNAADAGCAKRAVSVALETHGRIDLLVNIAGWYPTALVEDTTDSEFSETLASNLGSTFAMSRAAIAALRESRGAIVNMSSTAARFPTPGLAAYSAAKAGIEGFSRSLAVEVAPDIRVNVVAAGPTRTESVQQLMETDTTGAVQAVTANLPLLRLAEVDEIAEAVLFLGSPRASVITGQVLYANCGGHMA